VEISDSGSLLARLMGIWESTDVQRMQEFYQAAATTIETINNDKSVWNYKF